MEQPGYAERDNEPVSDPTGGGVHPEDVKHGAHEERDPREVAGDTPEEERGTRDPGDPTAVDDAQPPPGTG
jgi:hypothetical protein